MQSIDSIETYACWTSKDLVSEKEIKCNNIIKKIQKLIIFDGVIKVNIKEHNTENFWLLNGILIAGGSGSG